VPGRSLGWNARPEPWIEQLSDGTRPLARRAPSSEPLNQSPSDREAPIARIGRRPPAPRTAPPHRAPRRPVGADDATEQLSFEDHALHPEPNLVSDPAPEPDQR